MHLKYPEEIEKKETQKKPKNSDVNKSFYH